MFSADLTYNFDTPEKSQKAVQKLQEKGKADEGFSFEFVSEQNSVIVKVKAESSELLRKGMNVVFDLIETIEPEVKTE